MITTVPRMMLARAKTTTAATRRQLSGCVGDPEQGGSRAQRLERSVSDGGDGAAAYYVCRLSTLGGFPFSLSSGWLSTSPAGLPRPSAADAIADACGRS